MLSQVATGAGDRLEYRAADGVARGLLAVIWTSQAIVPLAKSMYGGPMVKPLQFH